MSFDLDRTLEKYADLSIRVGLNLRRGQRLFIQTPPEGIELARRVAASAYKAGARFVDVVYVDEQLILSRFKHAPRDSFGEYDSWRTKLIKETLANSDAILSFSGENPDLLTGQDAELVGQYFKTRLNNIHVYQDLLMVNASNWGVIGIPVPVWAKKVFPGLPAEAQVLKLWEALSNVCRLYEDDPVEVWKEHDRKLHARRDLLTRKQYTALKYRGPGTDLTVGLPKGHRWMGGHSTSQNGIDFIPNLPTEEVFTLPHRANVNGTVRASLPLNYVGALIDGFSLSFKDGRVVDYQAEKGKEFLGKILATDEGALHLGEVALVPQNSPIASSGMMFFNTLYDENAASHFALGRAYRFTLQGGEALTDEEFAARGGNNSLAHVDFMVGSGSMDIDGVMADDKVEPVMRAGNWVFEV